MIVRVRHPDQLRAVLPAVTAMFQNFLKRAGEPFPVEAQWAAILRALAESDRTLFLLAVDAKIQPIGFVLAQAGYDHWGLRSVAVHQFYAGKRANGLVREFDDEIMRWARDEKADYVYGMSRRHLKAFARRMRMTPVATMFVREVRNG